MFFTLMRVFPLYLSESRQTSDRYQQKYLQIVKMCQITVGIIFLKTHTDEIYHLLSFILLAKVLRLSTEEQNYSL